MRTIWKVYGVVAVWMGSKDVRTVIGNFHEERAVEYVENLNNVQTHTYPRALPWLEVRSFRPLVLYVTIVGWWCLSSTSTKILARETRRNWERILPMCHTVLTKLPTTRTGIETGLLRWKYDEQSPEHGLWKPKSLSDVRKVRVPTSRRIKPVSSTKISLLKN